MSENKPTLEDRIDFLERTVQATTARALVEGQIAEFLLSWLFFEKGPEMENDIKTLLHGEMGSSSVVLPDKEAVFWSDCAVLIEPVRDALLERVSQRTERFRQSDENQS